MTTHESFVLGWVYGLLESTLKNYDPMYAEQAALRPYTGFALIHRAAIANRTITQEVERSICAALDQINQTDEASSPEEPPQPLVNQGSWQLGRYKGKSGAPIPTPKPEQPTPQSEPEPPFDIKAARLAKGMTQAELAEAMGVYQNDISRWERGAFTPRPETLKKLKEILQ